MLKEFVWGGVFGDKSLLKSFEKGGGVPKECQPVSELMLQTRNELFF